MSHGMEHWHPNPDFFFLPGAGPVLDIGPYYIANLINLIGPVRRVAALATAATPTRTILTEGPRKGQKMAVKTPTNIHALLEFEFGATVTLGASWDVWAHRHGPMELYGTEGTLFVPDPNWFGGKLELAGRDGKIAEVAAWDHPFGRRRTTSARAATTPTTAPPASPTWRRRSSTAATPAARSSAAARLDVMTSILKSGAPGPSSTCRPPARAPHRWGPRRHAPCSPERTAHDLDPCRRPLRAHGLPPMRRERADAARHLARPLAQLRR